MSRKGIAVKKQQLKQAKLSEDIQHNFLYFFVYKKVFVHFSVYNKFVCTFLHRCLYHEYKELIITMIIPSVEVLLIIVPVIIIIVN